jgi:phosphatidylglycerophosphate synthase
MTSPPSAPPDRGTARTGEDRILTVPNLVTTIRLLCIPVFLWLLLRGPHHRDWYRPLSCSVRSG